MKEDFIVGLDVANGATYKVAEEVFKKLEDLGIRCEIDDRDEKLGYKMREAQMKKIPYQLVLGDSERDNKTVTYRHYGQQQQTTVSLEEFVSMLKNEIASKGK